MKLLMQVTYVRYRSAKLSKAFFYKRSFENEKGPGTSYHIVISITKRASEVK